MKYKSQQHRIRLGHFMLVFSRSPFLACTRDNQSLIFLHLHSISRPNHPLQSLNFSHTLNSSLHQTIPLQPLLAKMSLFPLHLTDHIGRPVAVPPKHQHT